MTHVLVTGGTGFIGRHCVEILVGKGLEVFVTCSKEPKEPIKGAHYIKANLLDRENYGNWLPQIQATHLLHLAWIVEHAVFKTAPENILWLSASIELASIFAKAGGARFVNAGSCMEYEWTCALYHETMTPCAPTTLYGASKHALFQSLITLAPLYDLSVASGRLFFLYGPYEGPSRLVSSIINNLLKKEQSACLSSNLKRDFLYVEDVADALVTLLFSDVTGAVNIAAGEAMSLGVICKKIAELCGMSNSLELKKALITPDNPAVIQGDIGRLTRELHWRPKYDLNNGLAYTVEWWQKKIGAPPFILQ